MIAYWIASILLTFVCGVLVGLYLSTKSLGSGRHRKPVSARPVLMPPTAVADTPTKGYIDQQQPWVPTSEDLEEFDRGLQEAMRQPSRIKQLREHYDTHSTAQEMETGRWEAAVASWRETAHPIDWGLTEEEKLTPLDPRLVEVMHDPLLPQKLQQDPEYLKKMRAEWEGVSGSLEAEPHPKVLRPEETSSSLLGLSQGAIRPSAGLKPVFGETEHLTYDPEDYEEPLICQPCARPLVKGETFWAVSLPEEGDGVFIPICDECEAKSHG